MIDKNFDWLKMIGKLLKAFIVHGFQNHVECHWWKSLRRIFLPSFTTNCNQHTSKEWKSNSGSDVIDYIVVVLILLVGNHLCQPLVVFHCLGAHPPKVEYILVGWMNLLPQWSHASCISSSFPFRDRKREYLERSWRMIGLLDVRPAHQRMFSQRCSTIPWRIYQERHDQLMCPQLTHHLGAGAGVLPPHPCKPLFASLHWDLAGHCVLWRHTPLWHTQGCGQHCWAFHIHKL